MTGKTGRGALSSEVIEYISGRGAAGADWAELAQGIGRKRDNINQCVSSRLVPQGKVLCVGERPHCRYFTDPVHAQAYAARLPELMEEIRKAKRERRQATKRRYEAKRVRKAPKLTRRKLAVEMVRAAGAEGMTRHQIELAMEAVDFSSTISLLLKRGLLISSGPHMMVRYFTEKEHAEAWACIGVARAKQQSEENRKLRMERNRDSKRASDARRREEARKERAKDTSRRKNAFVIVAGRDVPVKVHAPTRADLKAAQIVIPPHVKVQRCAPWTHDIRYQVGPGEPFHGAGLTAEWNERRRAA